jgi:DmsE family decaheme c-type cytochrome
MKENIMNWSRVSAISIIALVVIVSFISFNSYSQEKKGGAAEYIGADACKPCHADVYDAFKKSDPHWKNEANDKVAPGKKGCESCHGPGSKHAEAEGKGFILSFKGDNAKTNSDACLKCHEQQKNFSQFGRSVHKLSAVGCNDCHKVHGARMGKKLLKEKETDLCFSCHQDVKSSFYLANSHKVLQGAVKCSDCHTPHGSRERASLRRTSATVKYEACFKCHPEKRGPFVYEHLAMKTEGCGICHVPHGSTNRYLLMRANIKMLCAECHGTIHYPNVSCINCHTQIHGSNFSSRLLQ